MLALNRERPRRRLERPGARHRGGIPRCNRSVTALRRWSGPATPASTSAARATSCVWRHRGTQHKEFFRTLAEAREAKGRRQAGDRRPRSRVNFEEYFEQWIDSYAGRTQRGFSETTRPEYRRPIEQHALPRWRRWTLDAVEPADVRELFLGLRADGATTSAIRKLRVALSATVRDRGRGQRARHQPGARRTDPPGRARRGSSGHATEGADPRRAHGAVRANCRADWRLFFELLVHSGLRISEAIGLTWAHVELGERPRLLVTRAVLPGAAQAAEEPPRPSGDPALGRDGAEAARASPRHLPRRRPAGFPVERVGPSYTRRTYATGYSCRRPRARGLELGRVPHPAAHLRVAAVRRRQERQAGAGVAGPRPTRASRSTPTYT